MDFLKAEQLSSSKWRVLAIPFGGPFKDGKDTDGEFFSPRTDIKADWFSERPVLFHHGKDTVIKDETLGTEDDLELERDGWWATVWLDRSNRYWDKVNMLLSRGKMYGSSGPLAHLVKTARNGEILVWPHVEQTLTPTPANFFSRVDPTKALDDFTAAGIATEPLKALLADLDDPDLGPDLASAGDDPAMVRTARALASADALLARIKTI